MIICGIIMLLYYPFILPLFSPKKAKVTEETKEEAVLGKPREIKTVEAPKPLPALPAKSQTDIPAKEVVIENAFVRMIWTNEGAALKSVKLKQFKDAEAKKYPGFIERC